MAALQAVLFDADGVLVDAVELHYQALRAALNEHGFALDPDFHARHLNGRPTRVKLNLLSEHYALPRELHEEIHLSKQLNTLALIDQLLVPNDAITLLLAELRDRGLRIAVCSNALTTTVVRMLRAVELRALVDVVLGNDAVELPKPAPDIYQEGARRLRVPIESCAIVEDAPVGLQAARAAGPLEVFEVAGPHEVGLELLQRMERLMDETSVREAA